MDFNILVNQRVSNEWGLTLKQAFFFAYLYKLPTWSTKAKIIGDDANPYHWVTQKKIIEDLPILNIKPESIRTYFKPLEDKGLVKKHTVKSPSGSMMYIQVTEKAKNEWSKDWEKAEPTRKNNTSHPQKFAGAHPQKFADNHSTRDHETTTTPIVPSGDKEREELFWLIAAIWNKGFKNFTQIRDYNNTRKKNLKRIVKNYPKFKDIETWKGLFKRMKKSEWIMSRDGRNNGFKMNIDWVMKDEYFTKIVEGNYN